jgi:hypothetical protein
MIWVGTLKDLGLLMGLVGECGPSLSGWSNMISTIGRAFDSVVSESWDLISRGLERDHKE